MDVVTDLAAAPRRPRSVALGTFDGVHAGHQLVIGVARKTARERGLTATVVTFDHHPLAIVDPAHQPRLLTPPAVKQELIAALGVDELVVLHFDAALAAIEPGRVLPHGARRRPSGRGRGGRRELHLRRRAAPARPLRLPTAAGGSASRRPSSRCCSRTASPISSSRIRRLLHDGRLPEVRAILGRPPRLVGVVVHGDKRGRTLGFPTANIEAHTGMIFPGRGVYAARVKLHGSWYRAAVNVGHNPTFLRKGDEEAFVRIEAYLLDFADDAYGAILTVDFLAKLRDEEKFPSPEALVSRMHDDIARTAALSDRAYLELGL